MQAPSMATTYTGQHGTQNRVPGITEKSHWLKISFRNVIGATSPSYMTQLSKLTTSNQLP